MSTAPKQEQFVIEGGQRLTGEVIISGSKNAALKMIPACLLTSEPMILENVPDIKDVRVTCALMESLGAQVEWLDAKTLRIEAKAIHTYSIDPRYTMQIRSSIVFAGPMLARCGRLELPPPAAT